MTKSFLKNFPWFLTALYVHSRYSSCAYTTDGSFLCLCLSGAGQNLCQDAEPTQMPSLFLDPVIILENTTTTFNFKHYNICKKVPQVDCSSTLAVSAFCFLPITYSLFSFLDTVKPKCFFSHISCKTH